MSRTLFQVVRDTIDRDLKKLDRKETNLRPMLVNTIGTISREAFELTRLPPGHNGVTLYWNGSHTYIQ